MDPAGDTGAFLITTYHDAATARRVNRALRAEGIVTSPQGVSNVLMTDWGLHLYYNIVSLVRQTSVNQSGFPWTLARTRIRRALTPRAHARRPTTCSSGASCWPFRPA